ncbi:MAG: deoxyuridine 5'-triphosphate nucleotidohydrolase [Anaerovoracaceae bacterium]
MNRVGEFEKVSFQQFLADMKSTFYENNEDDLNRAETQISLTCKTPMIRETYDAIKLPLRATERSAGNDIRTPLAFALKAGESTKIPTGLRVKIDDGWFLACFPKSGLGFKYRLQLDNTIGIIDGDYYDSKNEGHIFLKITNDSREGKTVSFEKGTGVAQGVFMMYGITYSDNADGKRDGGFGSTGS